MHTELLYFVISPLRTPLGVSYSFPLFYTLNFHLAFTSWNQFLVFSYCCNFYWLCSLTIAYMYIILNTLSSILTYPLPSLSIPPFSLQVTSHTHIFLFCLSRAVCGHGFQTANCYLKCLKRADSSLCSHEETVPHTHTQAVKTGDRHTQRNLQPENNTPIQGPWPCFSKIN